MSGFVVEHVGILCYYTNNVDVMKLRYLIVVEYHL